MGKDYETAGRRVTTSGWKSDENVDEAPGSSDKFARRYVAEDTPEKPIFRDYYDGIDFRPNKTEILNAKGAEDLMTAMLEVNYDSFGVDIVFYVDQAAQQYIEEEIDAEEESEAFEVFIKRALTEREDIEEDVWFWSDNR